MQQVGTQKRAKLIQLKSGSKKPHQTWQDKHCHKSVCIFSNDVSLAIISLTMISGRQMVTTTLTIFNSLALKVKHGYVSEHIFSMTLLPSKNTNIL